MSSLFSRFFGAGAGFGLTAVGCGLRSALARCDATAADGECAAAGLDLDHTGTENLLDEDTMETLKRAGAKVTMPWHHTSKGLTLRYKPFRVIDNIEVAPDTKLIRFALEDSDDVFHLPPAATLQFRHGINGSRSPADQLERLYTPVTPSGVKGHFDIVVRKLPNGRMSNSLCNAEPGSIVDVRAQLFKLKYKPNRWDNVGMICGGTGITPMLQIIRAALPLAGSDTFCAHLCTPQHRLKCEFSDGEVLAAAQAQQAKDKTKLSLLYLNRNEDHIMFKSYIDELAERFPDRFKAAYAVDKPLRPSEWKGYTGYATREMVGATMPDLSNGNKKNIVMVCGPDGLVSQVTGCPLNQLKAMHSGSGRLGARRVQPLGAQINNHPYISGLLGECNPGVVPESVYKF